MYKKEITNYGEFYIYRVFYRDLLEAGESEFKTREQLKLRNPGVWFRLYNGDLCQLDDDICEIMLNDDDFVSIAAQAEGILIINEKFNDHDDYVSISDQEELFRIQKITDNRMLNIPIIKEDKFNKIHTLKWLKVGGNNYEEFPRINGFFIVRTLTNHLLFFTVNNLNGRDYIVINHKSKDFNIKAGDKFMILLENQQVIELSFEANSYIIEEIEYFIIKNTREKMGKLKENKAIITIKDLNLLANYKIVNWKIVFKTGQEIKGIDATQLEFSRNAYRTFAELQEQMLSMFQIYLTDVKRIKGYEPIESVEDLKPKVNKEKCHLYLMIDTTNGYYKIGISNKPYYREKTLQSEKPTIELIATKAFPSRKIAESIEKALHNTFSDKNIRGEWFNLSEEDVDDIISTMK
jgi:hypothetical protein